MAERQVNAPLCPEHARPGVLGALRAGLGNGLRLQPFEAGDDPRRAPSAYHGEEMAPRFTPRRAMQNRLPIYLLGLLFLVFSVDSIYERTASPADLAYRTGCLLLIALLYTGSALAADLSLAARWSYVAIFGAAICTLQPVLGLGVLYLSVYFTIMIACLVPWRQARIAITVFGLSVIIVGLLGEDWVMLSIAVFGIALGLGTGGSIESGRLRSILDRSRQRNAVLAVAAERERIARDLHDILGHSLTAIAIKTDLAQRLVDPDPAAAKAQLAEIEQVARQALADVRTTASNIREVRVATEIASARSVLLAAGVQASVPSVMPPMDDTTSEVLGFVVREAITNTVRHAEATVVTVTAGAHWVQVSDDGGGPGPQRGGRGADGRGSGLDGLLARVEAAGGELAVVPGPDGSGTVVRAELPERPIRAPRPRTTVDSRAVAW